MKLLEVIDIKKSYTIYKKEKIQVLKGLNVSFNKGEFISILGESGSGKSTLMNIIGGMDSDFEGDIKIDGTSLKKMKEKNLDDYRKNKIGFVFQSFNLIPHLNVLENVTIAMQLASKTEKERTARAKELLTEVGLKEHMLKKPNQLSGGQKQRVSIARALANEPDIILADEPTGALDKDTSQQILEILDEVARKGKLVIAVTHSQKVADFGSRIVRMDDGKITEDIRIKDAYPSDNGSVTKPSKSLSLIASFKLALKNMQLNAKRNTLVALGGSIGILSVILMLALGNGVTTFINDEITSSMDPLKVEITKEAENSNESQESGPPAPPEQVEGEPFTQADLNLIQGLPNIKEVEPVVIVNRDNSISYADAQADFSQLSTLTKAVEEESLEVGSLPATNEILITTEQAQELIGNQEYSSILGQEITLYINEMGADNKPVLTETLLTVSGVIIVEDNGPFDGAEAYVPYETLEVIYAEQDLPFNPTTVNAFAEEQDEVEGIKSELENAGFANSQTDSMLEQVTTYLNIATGLLAGIAGISLIVSGIMILVVLYISVVERTKEIGILRAVGARKKDIKRIFFSESALLGLFSGLIAVAGAFIISWIGNIILVNAFDVELIMPTFLNMLFGVAVSLLVSIIAGIMPSSKAANLDPMESLRHE